MPVLSIYTDMYVFSQPQDYTDFHKISVFFSASAKHIKKENEPRRDCGGIALLLFSTQIGACPFVWQVMQSVSTTMSLCASEWQSTHARDPVCSM